MGMAIARRVLQRDPAIQLRAVFDPDGEAVARLQGEAGGAPAVCSTHRELCDRSDVDWVMVASPNRYHSEQVVDAFVAGKHVFCQKPMAIATDQCLAMRDAWRSSGRMFNLGFTLRYSPHYRKIVELVSEGRIGRLISMEFNETLEFNHGGFIMSDWRRHRETAGSHLLEKCCHDIDVANWIVGSRARRVATFAGLDFFTPENVGQIERVGPGPNGERPYGSWRKDRDINPFTSDKDITDNQVVILEYESGVRASFHTNSNAAIPERRICLHGTEGSIRADVLIGSLEVRRTGWRTTVEDHATGVRGMHGEGDDVLADELVASMVRGDAPSVGIREGIESTVTCLAADEAMDSGTVVDLEPYWQKIDS